MPSNSRTYFNGQLDEIGIHNRAISSNEIHSIYLAGSAGRNDSSHPPTNSPPPSAQVVVAGVTNVVTGSLTWSNFTTRFTATNSTLSLAIEGTSNGLWLDEFQLVPVTGNQYYLPEESLDLFAGERALGNWILEVWDTRTGALLSNSLISWQLDFTFADITNAVKPLDFGDLNDTAVGTAVGNYQTLLNDGGPRHVLNTNLTASLRLGARVDDELDGQPTVNADGDDLPLPDDEDGVTIPPLVVGQSAVVSFSVANAAAGGARLNAFFDWNNDGDFADANETLTEIAVFNGANNLAVTAPNGTVVNAPLGARFRLSAAGGLAALGRAASGEVEDHLATATGYDFGDLPDAVLGTGPGNYETLLANNGPRHFILETLYLGERVDAEGDGQPNASALGDDVSGGANDEDGVTVTNLTNMPRGQSQNVTNVVFNNTGSNATLWGWIDFNANGVVNDGETQTNTVPPSALPQNVNLTFFVPLDAAVSTYARFRLGTVDTEVTTPNGIAIDGEVEDHAVTIESVDFGDLPDTTSGAGVDDYQTLLANDGPYHVIVSELRLGNSVDADTNGLPSVLANRDDLTGLDDEDGVNEADLRNMPRGQDQAVVVSVFNNLPTNATLWAWIDFNTNAVVDAGETQTNTVPPGNFQQEVTNVFSVPLTAAPATYARFRLGTDELEVTKAEGRAGDGEVEDYPVTTALYDFGDLNDLTGGWATNDYQTVLTNNGARHALNRTNISAGLRLGAAVDEELDGQPDASATGDDLAGLPDDEDGVEFPTFVAGQPVTVIVTVTNAPSGAKLNAFFDWNNDGDFSGLGETVAEKSVVNGTNHLVVTVSPSVLIGTNLGARFRLSTAGGLTSEGRTEDGEVEDYLVQAVLPLDYGDLRDDIITLSGTNATTLTFTNRTAWRSALGTFATTLIDFSAWPNGTPISTQYASNGAEFLLDLGAYPVINNGTLDTAVGGQMHYWRFVHPLRAVGWDRTSDNDTHIYRIYDTNGVLLAKLDLLDTTQSGGPIFGGFKSDIPIGYASSFSPNDDQRHSIDNLEFWGAGYPTLRTNDGPRHLLNPASLNDGLRLGATVDAELDGQPQAVAIGDDVTGADDEDGVFIPQLVAGTSATSMVMVANAPSGAKLNAFLDWNHDGDFADVSETIAEMTVTNGWNALVLAVPANAVIDDYLGARFRLSTAGGLTPVGLALDGEVEDHVAMVQALFDFGDLNDLTGGTGLGDYQTLLANNGPRHALNATNWNAGLKLGVTVDGELNGQPNVNALGDDLLGSWNDEDGVAFATPFLAGQPATMEVEVTNAPSGAKLNAFIDWNNDGDFLDANEALAELSVINGTNDLVVTVPTNAVSYLSLKARFRLSTLGLLSSQGLASDGEVEDYLTPDVQPLIVIGATAWLDGNGRFQIQWNAVPGQSYEVQTSANLVNWTTVQTIQAASPSALYISANPASASPYLFYRIKPAP